MREQRESKKKQIFIQRTRSKQMRREKKKWNKMIAVVVSNELWQNVFAFLLFFHSLVENHRISCWACLWICHFLLFFFDVKISIPIFHFGLIFFYCRSFRVRLFSFSLHCCLLFLIYSLHFFSLSFLYSAYQVHWNGSVFGIFNY